MDNNAFKPELHSRLVKFINAKNVPKFREINNMPINTICTADIKSTLPISLSFHGSDIISLSNLVLLDNS